MMADNQMERLEKARKKVNDFEKEKSRITGELDTHKATLGKIKQDAKTQFDSELDELPDLIEGLGKEAEVSLAKAEKILGIGDSEDDDDEDDGFLGIGSGK